MTPFMSRPLSMALACLVAVLAGPGFALAKTEIQLWHGMTGVLSEALEAQATQFNDSQDEFVVKPVRKGSEAETLAAAMAAYQQKNPPHLVQVVQAATQTMMLSGAVHPLFELLQQNGIKVEVSDFLKPVVGPYGKDGKLYALPYNAATPILYYNKDAFKKAGLDPEKPPRTWPAVAEHAKKLLASGTKCGFSTGRPSWTMVENMHAIHDQPVATKNNGLGAVEGVELLINREFGQKHIGALADWQENIYSYSGRGNAADPRYINGDCPMYIQSSALIAPFAKAVKFDWGTGELPQWGPPYRKATSITDGGALWALKGRPQAEYRGAARFLEFLAKPEQQMWWQVTTGDLVISHTAVKSLEQAYYFVRSPRQYTAFGQITGLPLMAPIALQDKKVAPAKPDRVTTPNSIGLRLGKLESIRDAIETELESIFSGRKAVKQGLDDAVAKSNTLLKEFAATSK